MVPAVGLSRVVRVALVVLVLAVLQLPQSEARTKDIGEHGKRDSKYYKWQRDKEEVAAKAAQAKERQLAREAEGERGPKVDLSAEEKELQQLRRAITRKEQYKREAIEAENFEEAARLRDEISDAKREVEQLQAAVKASSEQCKEDVDEGDDEGEVEEDEELVVGTDGIEIAAASEGEEEDYTSRCPDGYYDHDKNHVTREWRLALTRLVYSDALALTLLPQPVSRSTTRISPSWRRWWCTWKILPTSSSILSRPSLPSYRA